MRAVAGVISLCRAGRDRRRRQQHVSFEEKSWWRLKGREALMQRLVQHRVALCGPPLTLNPNNLIHQ